ncbi:MAG: tRNA (guanosine(46)-N7)-methyltransferase TrmB [Clostridia bacterium]
MRTRRKNISRDQLQYYDKYVCTNPENYKSKWNEYFLNNNEIHIELGTGRGQFLITLAERNPDINFIGLEMKEQLVFNAVQKVESKKLDNIGFLFFNAYNIQQIFGTQELSRIYINFCDPWPKKRWSKKRLTHKNFLTIYNKLLKEDADIHFKTDNEKLFEFSLNEFCENAYKLKNISFDLHSSDATEIITTEYEDKFVSKGMRIYRCEAINRLG